MRVCLSLPYFYQLQEHEASIRLTMLLNFISWLAKIYVKLNSLHFSYVVWHLESRYHSTWLIFLSSSPPLLSHVSHTVSYKENKQENMLWGYIIPLRGYSDSITIGVKLDSFMCLLMSQNGAIARYCICFWFTEVRQRPVENPNILTEQKWSIMIVDIKGQIRFHLLGI